MTLDRDAAQAVADGCMPDMEAAAKRALEAYTDDNPGWTAAWDLENDRPAWHICYREAWLAFDWTAAADADAAEAVVREAAMRAADVAVGVCRDTGGTL